MSLTKSFRQKVRTVRIRCSINMFLRHAGKVLAIGGALAALAILVQQLFAVPVLVVWAVWAFWGAVAGIVLFFWFLGLPSRMQASLLLDERLKLHERFSTTLTLDNRDDPFARAACAESMQTIQRANLRGHFPISLSRSWCYGAGIWAVAVGLLLYMPQKDLLGFLKKQKQQEEQARQLAEAEKDIHDAMAPVKIVMQKLDDPSLAEELKKLDDLAKAGDPQELKREAIKTLGDISDKIKQMQGGAQMEAGDILQRTLKQLHGSSEPFSQQIRMALAKGDFSQAAGLLRQLQKQLTEGTLSDQQRKQMTEQLQQLAKELLKLSTQQRELEDELQKLGLDKAIAQADVEQLKQAMQKQGGAPELIEQLAKKMEASQGACGQCAGLGQALAGIGAGGEGLSAEDLSGAAEQLDALDLLQERVVAMRAGTDEISRCVDMLGQGLCERPGGSGQQTQAKEGSGGGQGEGIGRSPGEHSITTESLIANKMTRAPTRADDSPVVASGYFRDTLVKGEARRPLAEVIQAGRASAAEAISDNQIPRRYEEAVKKYFDQLEESRR